MVSKIVPSENEMLAEATRHALKLMKDAGFEIAHDVRVSVDPDLPFMGYSTKMGGKDLIVVAGKALESGMVEGLLIHEMCHIYRTDTHHPSHNHRLLDRVGFSIVHEGFLTEGYQIKVLREAINHVQDLYADDISFQVFSRSGVFTLEQASDFFLSWIEEEPATPKDAETVWMNVSTMLNNCFVLSNMERHHLLNARGLAHEKGQRFLSQADKRMSEVFLHLQEFMVSLRENPTEKEFEEDLTNYLRTVMGIANELASTR
jgi:hypothetical protein